jgi:DNA-directed RNA polymerase specialized sigma24 family protein
MQQIEVVLAEAQAGDRAAYGRLVSRFQDMAVAYARSVLGDPHLAEDASQEAFVEALVHLNRVHNATTFPAWLRRIVFKHCDRIRRARRELVSDVLTEAVDPGRDALVEVEDGDVSAQVQWRRPGWTRYMNCWSHRSVIRPQHFAVHWGLSRMAYC